MSTKTCPSCGVDVPDAAARCKECFHDFHDDKPPQAGPIVLLAALAIMAVVGAITFWFISIRPLEERILVDEETRSIIFTTHYRTGPETERLKWDEVAMVQHITTPAGNFQIVAVKLDGTIRVIEESKNSPLSSQAEHYAAVMEKPFKNVDNTLGFHTWADDDDAPEDPN